MPEAVIVSAIRTPVGRAYKGSLRATRPDDLAALAIKEALARVPGLDAKEIDDVILGCAMPEGEQGMNVARIAALRAGLPVETSAMTINRFCSSGLQAIALAAERIRAGFAEPLARRQLSRRVHQHGPRHGKHCAQIRHHPRAGRPVLRRFPQKSSRRYRRRTL